MKASMIADSSLEGSLVSELDSEEIEDIKLRVKQDMKKI